MLHRDDRMLTLIHADPVALVLGTEVYTIFPGKGVVILSQQENDPLLGPEGDIQMGYCN